MTQEAIEMMNIIFDNMIDGESDSHTCNMLTEMRCVANCAAKGKLSGLADRYDIAVPPTIDGKHKVIFSCGGDDDNFLLDDGQVKLLNYFIENNYIDEDCVQCKFFDEIEFEEL